MVMCYSYYIFFSKKLVALLVIESLMIFLIMIYSSLFSSSFFSSFVFVLLSCFMVLDSVFGISVLICCSRSGTGLNSQSLFL